MGKRVLYISYDGLTDPLGQSQIIPYLEGLSAYGYEFTILSFEKTGRLEKEGPIVGNILKKAGINWVPMLFSKNPPVLSKIYDRLRLKQKAKALFKANRFDMVHCRSYVAAEAGLWLKKKYGTRFLFDMRGFWADEKRENGQWNTVNLLFKKIYRHYKQKEKEFLLAADGIISLTCAAKKEILSQPAYHHLQIDVIPCCADLTHFNYEQITEKDKEALQSRLGILPGQQVISYLGSLGGWYMISEMFAFYKRLLLRYPEFVMLLLTKDDPLIAQRQAQIAGIAEDHIIIAYAKREELPLYAGLSDCSLFFIKPTYSKIASSPTKHAELMGMGIPVICNPIGDTGTIIEETSTGMLVNDFTDREYDHIIDHMDEILSIPKEKIREAALQYFDLEKGVREYERVYGRLFKMVE